MRNLVFVGFLLLAACSRTKPLDFNAGEHSCDLCRMNIVDMRFKAEALSAKGKVYRFDSIECLKNWSQEHPDLWATRWVTDFYHPQKWIAFEKAFILKSDGLASPMGENLSAYATGEDLNRAIAEFGGEAQ
ncbi:MAG: nitrous oxide reductase accessory protein NosL [Deltaproteobacteria bacterium]|nr:nitrous oxide reductase accessory protein NosL [Deltaproteobacteria bacterium]MDZ4224615.1 nitrous oxide reductase accessory protein NosL [bacterium]